jgi:hypothetical protein
MPQVFISYRRSDSAPEANLLTRSLGEQLGDSCVFRDIMDIVGGDNFDTALDDALKRADAVVVLIGTTWLSALQHRQALPERDFVRLEVAQALQGPCRVIPVLLRGAEMPRADALPPDLQALTRKHAVELSDGKHWDLGVEDILQAVGKPYKWGALGLRAAGVLVATTVAVLGLLPNANILQARNLILAVMASYAVGEAIAALRGKGR